MVLELTPASLLLTFAGILLFGFVGDWLFRRTRVPDTLLLILVGFLISLLFDIDKQPFLEVMPFVGVLALIAILFDGGLELRFADLVSGLPRASTLAIAGFVLSVLGVAVFGSLFLGLDFARAAMLGAIIGGTSAVVVLPMLPGLQLGKKAETLIGLESSLTDVLCVVVTLALASAVARGDAAGAGLAQGLLASFSVALVLGLLGGVAWLAVMGRVRQTGSEYIWTMTALLGIYGITELLGGSGPIAVLAFAIILGNAHKVTKTFKLPSRRMSTTVNRMHDELVFFVRSFFFVFLGLVIDPSFFGIGDAPAAAGNATLGGPGLNETMNATAGNATAGITPDALISNPIVGSIGLFIVLIIARYGAVWLATLGDETLITNRSRFVLLMPRGLAAAVLAAIPAAAPYNLSGVGSFVGYAFAILLLTNLSTAVAGFVDPEKLAFKKTVRDEARARWAQEKAERARIRAEEKAELAAVREERVKADRQAIDAKLDTKDMDGNRMRK